MTIKFSNGDYLLSEFLDYIALEDNEPINWERTGIEFTGFGWMSIVRECFNAMVEWSSRSGVNPRATQIKEKLGELRFHFDSNTEDKELDRELHNTIYDISCKARNVCIECGGRTKGPKLDGNWLRPICETCLDNYKK